MNASEFSITQHRIGTKKDKPTYDMDWLLTMPLLLLEIVLVIDLATEEHNSKAWTSCVGSALMTVSGYCDELVFMGDITSH